VDTCGDEICDTADNECDTCYGIDCVCGDNVLCLSAGESCDDNNNNDGDGCSATCSIEIVTCTDIDGDRYIRENIDYTTCPNICGPGLNQSCLGANDCDDSNILIYPSALEDCDGLDN